MRRRMVLAAALLASGCVGPSLHPVTQPVPAGTEVRLMTPRDSLLVTGTGPDGATGQSCGARYVHGRAVRQAGDTVWLDPVRLVEPYTRPANLACVGQRRARVVLLADSARVERVQEAGIVMQAIGTAAMAAAVGATILLLYSAADGLIDALGRWF